MLQEKFDFMIGAFLYKISKGFEPNSTSSWLGSYDYELFPQYPSKVNWTNKIFKQNQSNVDYNDHFYRPHLRALQSVDELVPSILSHLQF
ncbi:MAG: hypothetical protein M1834_008787 [Cirrosporium novae-zelandiae]|nr:MAG: hypothetical protein M1834_008787 [Cirrosporium novae-zelandiae]